MQPTARLRAIHRIRVRLERQGFPRLQMLLIVLLTAASGFLASYGLLRGGMTEMWLRYLVAFAIAYVVFLGLLWLWMRTRVEDYAGAESSVPPDGPDATGRVGYHGRGGESGGGGASASYDDPTDGAFSGAEGGSLVADAAGAAGDAAADADELALPLLVLAGLALLGVSALSSFWIVYSAPLFLAELLIDGVLAATLYRRLRGVDSPHWLDTAVRRTLVPFTATAVLTSATGWVMAQYVPGAQSIGDMLLRAGG